METDSKLTSLPYWDKLTDKEKEYVNTNSTVSLLSVIIVKVVAE